MKEKLATLEDAVDRTLEAIAPEIQRQFNQLHGEVKVGNQTVVEKLDQLDRKFEESLETMPTRTELAADFADIAVRMAGGGVRREATGTGTIMTTTTTRTTDEDHHGMHGADWDAASTHVIRIRDIDSIYQVYNKFKGREAPCQDKPIVGGLEACEIRWKAKWRKHVKKADQKRFSRMSMLTKAIDDQVKKGEPLRDVLVSFDQYFRGTRKRSFCALISKLQDEGYIERKAARTKRVRRESPGEGGGGG